MEKRSISEIKTKLRRYRALRKIPNFRITDEEKQETCELACLIRRWAQEVRPVQLPPAMVNLIREWRLKHGYGPDF